MSSIIYPETTIRGRVSYHPYELEQLHNNTYDTDTDTDSSSSYSSSYNYSFNESPYISVAIGVPVSKVIETELWIEYARTYNSRFRTAILEEQISKNEDMEKIYNNDDNIKLYNETPPVIGQHI